MESPVDRRRPESAPLDAEGNDVEVAMQRSHVPHRGNLALEPV